MPIYNPQTGLYQADPSAYSDVVAAKTDRLQERTAAKQARLSPTTKLQQDILLGMNDADSLITRNFGGNTRSASKLDDYYDAVELDHGPDNLAIDAARDNKWKASQFDLVSTITGKPIEALTNQDFIDVGNQQQIQKLADLARSKDDPRWAAPLIQGATQTNLTGEYTDEFGRPTNIPLDVNIGSKYLGKEDKYHRPLVQYTDAQGVDVTGMHSQDPAMNANYVEPADLFGAEANGSYIGNLVDSAQFGIGRKIAGVADAVVDTATRGVLEAQKKYYGWTEEEAVNNLVKNSSLFKRDPKTGDFIGYDKYKTAEYYGYDNSRSQNAMDEIGKAKGFADTFLAIAKNVDAAPDLFLESSGELLMGVFKAPGLILNAFDYANQAMEDTIEAQGGKPLTNSQRAIDTLAGFGMAAVNKLGTDEMIGRTKFVKGLVGAASNKSKSAAVNIAKELGKSALIVAGKAGYEGVEEILQESMGILATKYNIGAEEIFDDETITQLKQAFGGGVLGGGFPAAVGVVKDAIISEENSAKFNEVVESVKNKAKSATDVPADVASTVQDDTTKPTGPIYSAVQGKSFQEASAMVSEQASALRDELRELQKTNPSATLDDIAQNKPEGFMDDLKEAGKYVKAMQDTEGVNETVKTGKLSTKLNATPEEEHNIINAYIKMEDDKLADFEDSLKARGADTNFPDDTPEQMAQIIDTAKAKRAAYNELSQLDKTRQSVATEGVSKTKKGFISYFQDAITSPAGSKERERSKDKLSAFTSSQIAKRDKLEAARTASVTPTVNTINNIANSTKRPVEDVWMAMTYASNISNKMGDPKFKKMYESFTPAEQKRMDVDTGIEVVDYASEHYNVMNDAFNRAEGTFEINGKTTLLDAANELGISTKVLGDKWAEGSSVSKVIDYTDREIAAMTNALNLIDKNTKRKATPTTEATTETSPEVPTEPLKTQTKDTEVSVPVEETKPPMAAEKPISSLSINEVTRELNKLDTIDSSGVALTTEEAIRYGALKERAKDFTKEPETSPAVQEVVQEPFKEEIGTTSPVKVEEAPKAPIVEVEDTLPGYRLYSVDDEASSAVTREEEDGTVLLDQVSTEPSARRKGYSKAVISKVIEDYGDSPITLSAEPKAGITMGDLVAFYESMGFKVDTVVGKDKTAMTRPANGTSESQKPTKEAQTETPKENGQEEVKEPVEDVTETPDEEYKLTTEEELEVGQRDADERQRMYEENEAAKKEAAKPKVVAKNDFVNNYLKQDFSDVDLQFLVDEGFKQVGTSGESIDVQAAVAEQRRAAEDRLTQLINEDNLTPDKRAKLTERIKELSNRRQELNAEIEDISYYVDDVNEFLDGTGDIIKQLKELYARREALPDVKETLAATDTTYNALKKAIKAYNDEGTLNNADYKTEKIIFNKDATKNYTGVVKVLQSYVVKLESSADKFKTIRLRIAKVLKALASRVVKAKTAFNKAVKAKDALFKELTPINAEINRLNEAAKLLYGEDWRENRGKVLTTFTELGKVNKELESTKVAKRGVGQTIKVLAEQHSKSSPKAAKSKEVYEGTDKGGKAEAKTAFTLGSQIGLGKATSEFGARPVTDEELNFLYYTEGELETLIANSGIQNMVKVDKNGKSVQGKPSVEDKLTHPYIMLLSDKEGNLNTNVAAAMKSSFNSYLVENFESLGQLSYKDVMAMYGYTEENIMEAPQELIDGGIPSTYIVDTLAKDIGKMIGIKPLIKYDKDGNVLEDYTEYYEKVTLGLAYAAVKHAEDMGIITEVPVSYKGSDTSVTYTYKLNDSVNNKDFKLSMIDHTKETEARFNIEDDAKVRVHTKPRTQKPEDIKKRNEDTTDVAPTAIKSIIKGEQERWDPSVVAINNILKIPTENARKLLGYADPDEAGLTKEQSISRIGKNRQIDMDLENLQALKDAIDSGETTEGVYFRWFMSKSGREMIDAEGGFNPQAIKLHRYLVTTKGQRGTVDTSKDPMSETMFKLGIAQAFGFKVDKKSTKDSIAFADAILLKDGKPDNTVMNKIATAAYNGESTIIINDEVTVHIHELAHSMTAIVEGRKFIDANGKPFDTSMTVEIDGLTNGFGHKILQYLATSESTATIDENTKKWLNKVGFTFGTREEVQDMVDAIAKGAEGGIVDAYLTLGEAMAPEGVTMVDKLEERFDKQNKELVNKEGELYPYVEPNRIERFGTSELPLMVKKAKAFLALMPSLRDEETGELSGFVRDLMKPPFMTFGYAAGFKSMSNSVTASLIDDVMNDVLNTDTVEVRAFMEALGVDMSVAGINQFKEGLRTKPYNAIVLSDGRNLLESFRGLVRGVYGDTVEGVMTDKFGAFRDINKAVIDSTNAMYQLFKAAYDIEMERIGIDGAPSKEVHQEILDKLKGLGITPVIKGPDSQSYEDGIALYDTKSELAAENKFGDAKVYRHGKGNSRFVRGKRRALTSPGAKGVVLLTQFTDGLGTARAMLKHSLLQVFDAYVLGVNQSNVIEDVNEDFVETSLNSEWTQTGAAVEGLQRVIANVSKHYPEAEAKAKKAVIKEKIDRFGMDEELAEKDYLSPSEILAGASAIHSTLLSRREDMQGETFTAEQFVLTKDAAFEYNGSNKRIEAAKDILNKYDVKDADSVISKISNSLEDILGCTNG